MSTAAHLINRSPSTALKFKCPEETWTGRKLNFNYLRVFSCEAYAHKSDGKLEPRSIRCVFVVYQEGTKGYRLWDRESIGVKIIISRDVIFNENVFSCKTNNLKETSTQENLDDFAVLGGPQIEVEQPAEINDLPAAPSSPDQNQLDATLPVSHDDNTSDHDDQEEQENEPEIEVEHDSSPQNLSGYQLCS